MLYKPPYTSSSTVTLVSPDGVGRLSSMVRTALLNGLRCLYRAGIITVCVAGIGFFMIPDYPDNPKYASHDGLAHEYELI